MEKNVMLVVEDDKSHLEAAKEQLKMYDLVTAKSFDAGLDALENNLVQVLLSDLMMPKGTSRVMGEKGMEHIFEQMAYGFPLALIAAQKYNVGRIAVITDMNHHNHPMSYALDHFRGPMKIDGSVIVFMHAPMVKKGEIYVKDWNMALEYISEERS